MVVANPFVVNAVPPPEHDNPKPSRSAALTPALLAAPSCAAIAPALRALLQEGIDAGGVALRDPAPVLADTLASLALLESDGDVLAAAILHVAPALAEAMQPRLERKHPTVLALLEGQRAATQVWALHAERRDHGSSEGLRRLLLAIVRDLRVVPILLARQLARLRHADRLPEQERRALAQLTRDIHAPLANRLGIWQLKWELEDLAFRYLDPDTYRRIARLLDEKRGDRERYIEQVRATLEGTLAAQGLHAEVAGRGAARTARPASGFLVAPVRGDAEFGLRMHLEGAYLHFQGLAFGTDHGRVQRTIVVALGAGDVVVEFARQRCPQCVHDAERRVAGGDILDHHPHRPQVV
jgi:hypothetical protein